MKLGWIIAHFHCRILSLKLPLPLTDSPLVLNNLMKLFDECTGRQAFGNIKHAYCLSSIISRLSDGRIQLLLQHVWMRSQSLSDDGLFVRKDFPSLFSSFPSW